MRGCVLPKSLVGSVCLVAAFFLSGCSPPNQQGPGHRSQRLALTPEQELRLGQEAYREVLQKWRVVRSGPEVERVRTVGEKIARAAEIEPLQRELNLNLRSYRFEWAFNVLQDEQVNAFCLPGGKVAVFTGLFKVVGNDDGELATVMSHEIAHALAHHASERLARQQMLEQAIEVISGSKGGMDQEQHRGILEALGAFAGKSYDRQQESEADHIGIFLMTFAGYNPEDAVRFWKKMMQIGANRPHPPEILSDHPSDARRLHDLEEWVPRAEGAYRAYKVGNVLPPRGR
jgi:predicted Zn-dependent protease